MGQPQEVRILLGEGRSVAMIVTRLAELRGRLSNAALRLGRGARALAEPRDWLDEALRKAGAAAERDRKSHAQAAYFYVDLWRRFFEVRVGGRPLTDFVRKVYAYQGGLYGTQVSVYPTAEGLRRQADLEAALLVAIGMTVTSRRVDIINSYSRELEVIMEGPSDFGERTRLELRSVPAGPSCRIVERRVQEPAYETVKYEVECVEGEDGDSQEEE